MRAEDLLEAMNDAKDEYVEEMMAVMRAPVPLQRKKPLLRTVLLAAALSCLLGATAYAVFRGSMAHREPGPTDAPGYYITDAGESGEETLQLNWGDAAMILHFETKAEGLRHAFRFTWMPEGMTSPNEHGIVPYLPDPNIPEVISIETIEDVERVKQLKPALEPDAEKLRQMGLTLEEAESLRRTAECWRDGNFSLRVDLMDVDMLYNHDLVLGGEASVVREDRLGSRQLLEVEVSPCEKDPQALRCLFLFEPEEQYLIAMIADPALFSYPELEAIADGIEVRTTALAVRADPEAGTNWSVLGLGRG
ncbi:MAG: hypothetical protein J6P58_06655 [Oscillospiraceae bacterium]|nr:hypothetical protein [Oscillospiraceae bacterium]